MLAVKTDLAAADLPESLNRLRAQIEYDVPVGVNFHKQPLAPEGSREALNLENRMQKLEERFPKLRILDEMGTKSFIVRGKGEASSYCSCSYGAGRRMSRTQAARPSLARTWRLRPQALNRLSNSDPAPRNYLGLQVAGFPNVFTVTRPGNQRYFSAHLIISRLVCRSRQCRASMFARDDLLVRATGRASA
jgi:hypothetical protein